MIATHSRLFQVAILAVGIVLVAGCEQTIPKDALQLSPENLAQRQAQTRRFDTTDEALLLSASAAVLQDLGFNLDESETELGLIVASKDRDATEAGQIIGAVLIAVLTGVSVPVDQRQKIRASLVTRPFGESGDKTAVRVTFQRVVWNTSGNVSKSEAMTDPEIYQEFFSKLSKSVFLEAHEI
jgi:hypothetical protein